MAAQDLILLILIGGILGAVGQGIRVIVGLKKLYDDALQKGVAFSQNFNGSSLLFSLFIGFIAGVLGMLGLEKLETLKIGKEQIITLIGIGYAGADFIEGFVKKNTPQFPAPSGGTTVPFTPPSPAVPAVPTPPAIPAAPVAPATPAVPTAPAAPAVTPAPPVAPDVRSGDAEQPPMG